MSWFPANKCMSYCNELGTTGTAMDLSRGCINECVYVESEKPGGTADVYFR